MPISRREDSSDPLAPFVILLWQKKWIIIGVAVLAAVLTYVGLLFVHSSYKVKAEVFVNRLPAVPEGETPNPDTVSSLLKSPSVLAKVRNDFVKKFDVPPPKLEMFIKQFDVKSSVLQDTSVRKEISPVIELEVEAQGAEESRYIMESWVRNFIAQFGNYTAEEALMKLAAYKSEKDRVEKDIEGLSRRKIEIESKLPFYRKLLAENLDRLSPARLRISSDEDAQQNSVQFIVQTPRMMPGLLERYSEAELRLRNGEGSTTVAAELKALKASIDDTTTSVAEAEARLAEAMVEDAAVTRELDLLTAARKAINDGVVRFTVASAVYKPATNETLPAGGDIRALSMPVTPEARVWPKRSLSAIVAAIVAGVLATFIIILNAYIGKVTTAARRKSA